MTTWPSSTSGSPAATTPATYAERVSAARTVTAVAAQGDEVARAIVDEQGRRLALYAEVAARKVGLADRRSPSPSC